MNDENLRKNDSGIEINETYTFSGLGIEELPGKYPFTRGIRRGLYRGKFWTMRQYAGFSTAEESNKRYHYLLSKGTTGLSVAFDLPTQIGYDSNHELSAGEVGKVGVAIDSLKDMETLFKGIELEKISTSMTINSTASILLAMYIALAKKQGTDLSKLNGTIQNDILKEYAARGTYIYPPRPSMRLITDIFDFCSKEVPKWNTISISGYHIREAGSTAVQEVAFTLANGKAYVQAALDKGLDIDVFGQRLSFFFNAHNDFFEEIAKFRAARRMWAKIMKEMGAKDERTMKLRFHTQTGGSTLTAKQPENNIVRVALQAVAAVIGGTQSLHTNGYDEALSLPTEKAAGLALRTQQLIAYESGIADTDDPMGGSFFIEELTNKIEELAFELIKKIELMGGAVAAIEKGFVQNEILKSAYDYQSAIENGSKKIIGINCFEEFENQNDALFKIDDSIRQVQTEKIAKLKAERNNDKVNGILNSLQERAKTSDNLMPLIIEAVEEYATLGEIADALRNVFGEYKG
jgi:methylmalonyl-CoA mutase, N-terminal domain